MKKILHLTLKKKWFDLIASGKKKIEYREIKPYWSVRLVNNWTPKIDILNAIIFDEIHFRNGYRKNSPFMRVEWNGLDIGTFDGKLCFAIHLGKVLEVYWV